MVRICGVPGCDSNDTKHKDIKKLSAESQTINYRREWIVRVKREDPIPKKLFLSAPSTLNRNVFNAI